MAVYKVPQDVEAEDKLVGPLSLRQFIFAIIAIISGYLVYVLGTINIVLIILPLPSVVLFGILALPIKKDQPMEIYLLARLRFFFKPHNRIWNQEGVVNLVNITAPKVIAPHLTDELTQIQVRSRLKDLANVMDTRGWSSKNVALQEGAVAIAQSDRLALPSQTLQETDIRESDDIMDPFYNSDAQKFDDIATKAHDKMIADAKASMFQAPAPVAPPPQQAQTAQAPMQQQAQAPQPVAQPAPNQQAPTAPEPTLPNAHYDPFPNMRQHVINPANQQPSAPPSPTAAPTDQDLMTPESIPDKLKQLAETDSLSVETLSKEADRVLGDDEEVEISLH